MGPTSVLALAVATGATASTAMAKPNLGGSRSIGPLVVYPDDQKAGLFYYGPGELAVAQDAAGKPDVHFLQTRYTGSVSRADRGAFLERGLLSFRVVMRPANAEALREARRALSSGPSGAELRPLPIQRLEAAVVYTPIGDAADKSLPGGHFDGTAGEPAETAGQFWTSRSYALALDPQTSELFWGALTKGQVILSLSYAFYATGSGTPPLASLVGTAKAVDALRQLLASTPAAERDDGAPQASVPALVRAGAFAVSVDAQRWPDLLQRVDLNERVPPGYPLLDVFCYDFSGATRSSLYEKQVEIEAEGAAGGRVRTSVRFGRDQPDLYARSIRFGLAVRLDRPYRYRVTEVSEDGTSNVASWRDRSSWTELLDVTTATEPGAGPPMSGRDGAEES